MLVSTLTLGVITYLVISYYVHGCCLCLCKKHFKQVSSQVICYLHRYLEMYICLAFNETSTEEHKKLKKKSKSLFPVYQH